MTIITAVLALKFYLVVYSYGQIEATRGPYAECPKTPPLAWRYEVRCERHDKKMPQLGWRLVQRQQRWVHS